MKCSCGRNPVIAFVNTGKSKTVLKPKCRRCLIKWIYGSMKKYYKERKERRQLQYDKVVETSERSKPGITVWTKSNALQSPKRTS